MKTQSSSTGVAPLKTPAENEFISTVTSFHDSNYGIITSQNHRPQHGSHVYSPKNLSGENNSTPSLVNFLQVNFDFAYLLCTCPFRIGKDEKGRFTIKKNKIQMILCAIMHLLCLVRLTTEVRVSINKEYMCKNSSKNPIQYFNIIMNVSSFIYKMVTIKRFWCNQADYLNIIMFIQGKRFFRIMPSPMRLLERVSFLRILFGLVTFHAFLSFFIGKELIDQSSTWSLSLWCNQLVKISRFTFGLTDNFSMSDTTIVKTTTATDIFITALMGLSLLERFIVGLYCDFFLLANTMMLWIVAKAFATGLERDMDVLTKRARDQCQLNKCSHIPKIIAYGISNTNDRGLQWAEVYDQFCIVKKLAILINIALGSQVTWYMAEAVMYYSVRLNKFLTSTDIFVRLDLAVFYFTTFGILFVSADICSQMEYVKLWISFGNNRKTVPVDEFSIVLHEMSAKDTGIRGNNVFTITYSLLAVFFSTIVTYFIICVQQGGDETTGLPGKNGTSC